RAAARPARRWQSRERWRAAGWWTGCSGPSRRDVIRGGSRQQQVYEVYTWYTAGGECDGASRVLALGSFFHDLAPQAARGAAAARRPARARVRRTGALRLRPGPPWRPLGPPPRRPFPPQLGNRQAHQHRDFTGSETAGPRRSRTVP